MSRYDNAGSRFMRWSLGDLFFAIPEVDAKRHEAALENAVEADVNAAVAEAVDGMEVLPTDLPATFALKVRGAGGGFVRLVSLADIAAGLDGFADAAVQRAAMADRLEEIARGLREGSGKTPST